MSENSVEYELGLKDNFSGPLNEAKHHAEGFHHSMLEIVEALGLIEAAHEAFDFLKESLSEYEAHQVAVASLTQMYNNNSDSVGINLEKLKELADQQEKLTGIHTEDTMAAEQNLIKFKQIKISYEELIPVIGDFAKATKTDAAEAANTLGRALENPERAMRLLMQAGVSPEQIKSIENLQKMGQTAKAQQEIFEILKDKYHGVAKAMFDANPAEQMAIQMKELKEEFGQVEEKLMKYLMPAIHAVFDFIHETIEWLREHKEAVKNVGIAIGIVASAFLVYKGVLLGIMIVEKAQLAIMSLKIIAFESMAAYSIAAAAAEDGLTVAQWALNVAMDANPIGVIIVALTALVGIIYECYKHWDQLKISFSQGIEHFKLLGLMIWENITSPFEKAYYSLKRLKDLISGDTKAANEDLKKIADVDIAVAKAKYDYWQSLYTMKATNDMFDHLGDKKGEKGEPGKTGVQGGTGGTDLKPKSEKVTGSSHVTINVVIQKMTGIEHFVSTTTKGAQAVGESIEQMMLGSINQFQASVDS